VRPATAWSRGCSQASALMLATGPLGSMTIGHQPIAPIDMYDRR
jgi:hypothetical protein